LVDNAENLSHGRQGYKEERFVCRHLRCGERDEAVESAWERERDAGWKRLKGKGLGPGRPGREDGPRKSAVGGKVPDFWLGFR
jgi:hypothetical protein